MSVGLSSKVTFWTRENGILIPARKRSSKRHTNQEKGFVWWQCNLYGIPIYRRQDETIKRRFVFIIPTENTTTQLKKAKSVYFYEMVWFQFSEDVSSFIQQQ